MATKLNQQAFEYAKDLIRKGRVVLDGRDAWSEHQPSAEREDEFIRVYGIREFARWYLGMDTEVSAETKGAYKFPFGDFSRVHRCGVSSAESTAGEYPDIEDAAVHLLALMAETAVIV